MTVDAATQMAREIAGAAGRPASPHARRPVPRREEIRDRLAGRRHVLFAARGSSDNAAIYGRYLLETHARRPAGLVSPSVATQYRSRLDLSDTVVVGVSEWAAPSEIVETLDWAEAPALHGGRQQRRDVRPRDVGRPGPHHARRNRARGAGNEELSHPGGRHDGARHSASDRRMPRSNAALAEVPSRVEAVLADADRLEPVVAQLGNGDSVVTGRGLMMGTASIALKLEETCARPVRGYSYADLRHGPISAVREEGVTAVLVGAARRRGPLHVAMIELADDLRTRTPPPWPWAAHPPWPPRATSPPARSTSPNGSPRS